MQFLAEQKCLECFRATGVLWMSKTADPGIRQARTIFEDLNIAHDWLDAPGILRRYPQIRVADDTMALFEPDAGALLAERSVQAVLEAAVNAGVHYETAAVKAPDTRWARLKWVETTEGQRIPAESFIFAAGSWLPKLFSVLKGIIRPTRQELFFFDPPGGVSEFNPDALPIWIDQTEPRIGYGFPDFGNGVKLGFHRLGPAFDPDESPREIEDDQISEAAAYLAERFPGMQDARFLSARLCHYENTPNGDFLIDRHPGIENAWFLGGGSGHGFKHAPGIAEYVLNAVNGQGTVEPRFSLEAKQQVAQTRVL
jgi:glycine/D-amino acid oxidase-like deaminating enzyme